MQFICLSFVDDLSMMFDDDTSHLVTQLWLWYKRCRKCNSSASILFKDSSDVKEQEGETWGGARVHFHLHSILCLRNGHVSLAQTACMQGKCKNGSKWPTNNHVSGLTLSRQCVHTLRCAENKHSTPTHKEK